MSKKQYMAEQSKKQVKKIEHCVYQFVFYLIILLAMIFAKLFIPIEYASPPFRFAHAVISMWAVLCVPYYFVRYVRAKIKLKELLHAISTNNVIK